MQSSETAATAALAVAREQGLNCDDAVVLRAAWHILLHLRPLPIVARVSSSVPFPEGANAEDVVRELAVAGHAARAGAPVIPPADEVDPGPHRKGGHIVALWRYIDEHREPDPREAGRALRAVHDALADYHGPLPATAHSEDTEAMLAVLKPSRDTELLRDIASRGSVDAGQALHGDAHLWNCLGTPAGPLWHDFETACRGPREYDLAALVSRDRLCREASASTEALEAYGPHDGDLLDAILPLYVAWVTASMMVALPRRPELKDSIDLRLRWLRERDAR
jgi:Ser/Thr protein kinase RdoA (MazF antagonist)